jgi:hypothetical protein
VIVVRKEKYEQAGAIIAIRLENYLYSYFRRYENAIVVFEYSSSELVNNILEILGHPIYTCTNVDKGWYRTQIKKGAWIVLGEIPFTNNESNYVNFYTETMGKYSILENGVTKISTYSECIGRYRAIVWRGDVFEKTLRDHFSGMKNENAQKMLPLS